MNPCGKAWHNSLDAALLELHRIKNFKNVKRAHCLSVYECTDCEGWHVGHDYRLATDFGDSLCIEEMK